MELEEALARIGELEGQVSVLTEERERASERMAELEAARAEQGARLAEVSTSRETAERALSDANGALAEAQARSLAHLRRALLAEHAGEIVPELIAGESEEVVLASVEGARQAYGRAIETARATLAREVVPAGAPSARLVTASAGLTPLEMIESGLRK